MAKGIKRDYNFFRVFVMYGTESESLKQLWFVHQFVQRYGCDPSAVMRRHDIKGGYVNKFVDLLDAVEDEAPHMLEGREVELRDPVGRVIRKWSTTRSWRKGSSSFVHQKRQGETDEQG